MDGKREKDGSGGGKAGKGRGRCTGGGGGKEIFMNGEPGVHREIETTRSKPSGSQVPS